MTRHRFLLGATLLLLAQARPLSAQRILDWQNQWYWGLKGGTLQYSLPTSGNVIVPQIGGEWVITARRVALYVGYSTTFQAEEDVFQLPGRNSKDTIAFDAFRRIQIGALAMIGDKALQPYVGIGFVIHSLSNARSMDAVPPQQPLLDAIKNAASGGFFQIMGGAQLRFAKHGALFGHVQYSPQGQNFMLAGGATSVEAGLRWAFLPAKENDPTRR